MMNAIHHSSCLTKASLAFKCCAALVFGAALITAQSKPAQSNSNNSGKPQHTTTLRSSDTVEGSRVALNSDQSLSDYEAYRRGDRFYVKIPAADVPRAEATRGRGFADVKVQRGADSTVISFRLQPGATAHVEQRSNKLDVVFSAPGTARVSATGSNVSSREAARTNPGSNPAKAQAKPLNSSSPTARNAAANTSRPKGSEKSGSKPSVESSAPKTVIASVATPTGVPTASPKATPAQNAAVKPTPSTGIQPTPATTAAWSEPMATSWQSRLKERTRYWILLAQLNPVPVVIGAVILALLIVLLLFQRRRLKAPRRVRASRSELKKAKSLADAASVQASESRAETIADLAVPTTAVAAAVATSREPVAEAEPLMRDATSTVPASARQARVATVAEQVKNVMAGEQYDQSVIGSDDRETRQLVGAELLSALVGRNLQRRDRARAAFMNHGYFDDATRDLRIADAPVERAAAARRLSFVHDREATPHLIAALDDSAPEVRSTAVEALMDLRDPAAIGPLNSLMQTDRKVPRTLIKHAMDACATGAPADDSAASNLSGATPAPQLSAPPIEPEREVIEL
ncbi:MAG TPA: HEAT repeat domain-containing protein [Pyrinomonadaceae bacterium]|nr:HEAT repeat domain-containing protein [Pyrinomonadaceae bacterium]